MDAKAQRAEAEQLQYPHTHNQKPLFHPIRDLLSLSKIGPPQVLRIRDIILKGAIIMDSATKTVGDVDIAWMALTFNVARILAALSFGVSES